MANLEWKKIALARYRGQESPPLDSVVAATVPLETSHSIGDLAPETSEIMESLQTAVYSGSFSGEEVTLPRDTIALVFRRGEIESIYEEGSVGLGTWLQKFSPWEGDNLLVMADMRQFGTDFTLAARKNPDFLVCFCLEIALDREHIAGVVRGPLGCQPALIVADIRDSIEDHLADLDFLYYITADLLQNNMSRVQIEKKAHPRIAAYLQRCGLKLCSVEIEGRDKDRPPAGAAPMQETKSITARAEKIMDAIEDLRQRQSLWDARYSDNRGAGEPERVKSPLITEKISRRQALEERPTKETEDTPPERRDIKVPGIVAPGREIVDLLMAKRESVQRDAGKDIDTRLDKIEKNDKKRPGNKMALEETNGN